MKKKEIDLYINKFFSEKDIKMEEYEIEKDNKLYYISTEDIIKMINKSREREKEKLVNILMQLDYIDGDINDFLRNLAIGYVIRNG